MHVGDFKAQSVPCSDAEFEKIRDLFKSYPTPVVYTPGDNEWTDCHGVGADPVERLTKLLSHSRGEWVRFDAWTGRWINLKPRPPAGD